MTAVTIRGVPDDALAALKVKAVRSGKSLQAYLRDLVTRDAATPPLQDLVARMRDVASADLSDTDVSAVIDDGRERR
ncbi:FitA-like ribbon-helix-helix domain-containing protein [Streptomyces hainanensis]|uniref:Antitoxin n=1 Tax=Streptomyces hainanensis TaxID=402648 RepID=A0A4R4TX39_9ACTN|nr:antitoxin [Streptomyces hainanensis]TDC78729.1 antitoxin [Streptomyces hainanensis]